MTIPSIHTQHEHLHSAERLRPAAATGTLLLCKNVGDRGEDTAYIKHGSRAWPGHIYLLSTFSVTT